MRLAALSALTVFGLLAMNPAFAHQVIPGLVNCPNCGDPNTDWRRYRNTAYNECIWGEPGDTACRDAMSTRAILGRDDKVRVTVCSGIQDIIDLYPDTFGCFEVSVWLEIEGGFGVDIPWVVGEEDFRVLGDVKEIVVRITPPNGDTKTEVYDYDQPALATSPPGLVYPPGHPFNSSPRIRAFTETVRPCDNFLVSWVDDGGGPVDSVKYWTKVGNSWSYYRTLSSNSDCLQFTTSDREFRLKAYGPGGTSGYVYTDTFCGSPCWPLHGPCDENPPELPNAPAPAEVLG